MLKFIILALFVCMVIVLGLIASRRTKTVNDFVLGGRSIGPWMSAFAFGTTYFSAVLLIGFSGKVGLYYKKATKTGAWAGMVTGVVLSLGGYLILQTSPGFIPAGITSCLQLWGAPFFSSLAIILPCFMVIIVSQFTKPFQEEHINHVFAAGSSPSAS